METPEASAVAEFCRLVDADQLGPGGLSRDLTADSHERAALAKRFALQAIDSLDATVQLTPASGDRAVRLRATFTADVVQTCVVTLDPVPVHLRKSFEILFEPVACADRDVLVTPDGDDDPEPLLGDSIDLGEVIAQQLGLNLDPYPRSPDVVFSAKEMSAGNRDQAEEDTGSTAEESPFAVLRNLKSTT
jgi:uncharacterized metal-binding protein YceD (DUF177 family)